MKHTLLSAALLFAVMSCGSPSARTADLPQPSALDTILQAEDILLKEAKTQDEIQDELDTDHDGEVSTGEMKAGLDQLGQEIKAAIESKHEAMRAAQDESKDKIKTACEENHGSPECRAAAQEERDKLKATRQQLLETLQKEIDALQGVLLEVETQTQVLS